MNKLLDMRAVHWIKPYDKPGHLQIVETAGKEHDAITELITQLTLRGSFYLIAGGEWLPDQDDLRSKETNLAKLADLLPEVLAFVQDRFAILKNREMPLEELIVSQTLSCEPDKYSVLSSVATAAHQLQVHGKTVKMGQRIRFIYIGPAPGVHAWDLPTELDPRLIDVPRYRKLAFRAVHEVLQPLNVTEKILRDWLFSKAEYITQPGLLGSYDPTRVALLLFSDMKYLHGDTL